MMVIEDCGLIVIACNTVTTSIIKNLRQQIGVPLIGMEPMVKPAAESTKTGVIGVFATPTTLKSRRYQWLKNEYCKNIAVIEPDCSAWSKMIEDNRVDRWQIESATKQALDAMADIIVLGCTHYHWIEDMIKEIAGDKAKILQPEQPVIRQLKRLLQGVNN